MGFDAADQKFSQDARKTEESQLLDEMVVNFWNLVSAQRYIPDDELR
jgi:hypothetical protein